MSESNLPIVRPPKPGERILAVKERAVLPTQKRKRETSQAAMSTGCYAFGGRCCVSWVWTAGGGRTAEPFTVKWSGLGTTGRNHKWLLGSPQRYFSFHKRPISGVAKFQHIGDFPLLDPDLQS